MKAFIIRLNRGKIVYTAHTELTGPSLTWLNKPAEEIDPWRFQKDGLPQYTLPLYGIAKR